MRNVKKSAILFKLFWYKVFVPWKLKLLNFLMDSILILLIVVITNWPYFFYWLYTSLTFVGTKKTILIESYTGLHLISARVCEQEKMLCINRASIRIVILQHEKFLQFDWLRAVVFQLNLKYLHVKITNRVLNRFLSRRWSLIK